MLGYLCFTCLKAIAILSPLLVRYLPMTFFKNVKELSQRGNYSHGSPAQTQGETSRVESFGEAIGNLKKTSLSLPTSIAQAWGRKEQAKARFDRTEGPTRVPTEVRALPNGGERNGGYATFVWQERAQTRATQMTHAPSLKPLCLLCQNQGSFRHRRVICLSHRNKRTPH